jgi:O-antigen ligase/tetratricopeptide (TPR) repeat protein
LAVVAAIATPLYFAPFTERVFEPEKAGLVRVLGLLAASALLGQALARRDRIPSGLLRHPLVAAALMVWAAEALATLTSVAPVTSLMGNYERGQGLLTLSAMLALGGAAAALARKGGTLMLAAALGASAFPAGLYGIVQRLGLDPVPWLGDVVTRVSGPAGSSVMLGAQLAMALPFGLLCSQRAWQEARLRASTLATWRLLAWLAISAVSVIGLALTASRGPLLGLAAAMWASVLATTKSLRARLAVSSAGLLAVAFVVLLNLPGTPLQPIAQLPLFERLSTALNPQRSTTRVRLYLWQGSAQALAVRPERLVTGYGPDATDRIWAAHYPPMLAYDEPRGYVPDRAHNLALDRLLSAGAVGLFSALALFAAILHICLHLVGRTGTAWVRMWCLGGLVGAAVGWLLGGAAVAGPGAGLGMVAGLLVWLTIAAPQKAGEHGQIGRAGLAAMTVHMVDLQVGFATVVTGLFTWLLAGALLGLTLAGNRGEGGEVWPGCLPPFVTAVAFIFAVGRPGLVTDGPIVALALVVVSALVVGAATLQADNWARAGLQPAPTNATNAWLPVLAVYISGHLLLARAGTTGSMSGLAASTATAAWAAGALLAAPVLLGESVKRWMRWPPRRELLLAPVALLALAGHTITTLADAAYHEGRLEWQEPSEELLLEGHSGQAEAFLEQARVQYELAAGLIPWEPNYRLAVGRAWTALGDVAADRLSRTLAQAGLAELSNEYVPPTDGRAFELAKQRDSRFATALRHFRLAEALARGWPTPVLTRARTMRLWAERSRAPEVRTRRLNDARTAYQEAMAVAPRWPEVKDEAAAVALLLGDARAALQLGEDALATDHFFVRAWRTAAQAHLMLGDEAAAARAYGLYFADPRNASDIAALRPYLGVLVSQGRYSDSLEVARSIVTLAPEDAHAHADLASVLDRTGARADALRHARAAAELDPDDVAIRRLVERLSR